MQLVLEAARSSGCQLLDLTGGAPELNRHWTQEKLGVGKAQRPLDFPKPFLYDGMLSLKLKNRNKRQLFLDRHFVFPSMQRKSLPIKLGSSVRERGSPPGTIRRTLDRKGILYTLEFA
jgi:hypothetical protein